MAKKEKRGGKRQNAGRKPLPKGEKKVAITVFPTEAKIEKIGGIETAKEVALEAINQSDKNK